MRFQATILHCKAILGRGQRWLMNRILVGIMPQVQDHTGQWIYRQSGYCDASKSSYPMAKYPENKTTTQE